MSADEPNRTGGTPSRGATSPRTDEAEAFEEEFPGASWRTTRAARELVILGTRYENLIAGVARHYGLSHAALNALAVIEAEGRPLPAGEVGARMHITSGTMTSVLDTLERNGYVKRLTDPNDRRRVLVEITPSAEEVLDRILPEVAQLNTTVMGVLDERALGAFLDALATIGAALEALPDELPPPHPRRTPPALRRS